MQIYDVAVIGLGIAGLTATLYLARQGLQVVAISRDIGGQLARVPLIENYPGTGPVPGIEIIRRLESEIRRFSNVKIELDEVVRVSKEGEVFQIHTARGHTYQAHAVIVASGKVPRRLGLPDEDKYLGRGLSYCVICDAPLFRNKRVLLVSTYEPHLELIVSTLVSYCSQVYWIPEGVPTELTSRLAQEHEGKLILLQGWRVVELLGEDRLRGVKLRRPDGGEEVLEIDGVFVELGHVIKTDFIRDLVRVNERGEIIVDELCRTSCEGVFAAGDVTAIPFKQAVIAAGQGAVAALSACEYLARKLGVRIRRVDWSTPRSPTTPFRITIRL